MEVESEDQEESEGVVDKVGFVPESDTDISQSLRHRGLSIRACKPEKSDLISFLVMQMSNDVAAWEEDRKLRAEERQELMMIKKRQVGREQMSRK